MDSRIWNYSKKTYEKLTSFIKAIKANMETIMKANSELTKLIKQRSEEKNNKDYNLCGSVCSYYLQSKEWDIRETIFIHCKNKGLIKNDSCVLCADGLMVEKSNYYDGILNEFKD